jgi:hypothetical protein
MLTTQFFSQSRFAVCKRRSYGALYAFEALSEIKINFIKTEMIPMEEANILAALVGCKISFFPLKYLRAPLFDGKLKLHDWHAIIDKVQQKISN